MKKIIELDTGLDGADAPVELIIMRGHLLEAVFGLEVAYWKEPGSRAFAIERAQIALDKALAVLKDD